MGCISKINNCSSYTGTEKKIVNYILHHREEVIFDTAQVLGDKIKVSAAALIRLSKKLGYQGFTEFKMDLAMEQEDANVDVFFCETIKSSDSLETILKKHRTSTTAMIQESFELIHQQTIEEAIEKLKNARRIYLFGLSASGICCLDFAQKLSRIDFPVVYYTDYHMQITSSSFITEQDVAIAISSRGNTKEVNAAMRHARDRNAATIAITQSNNSPLCKLADTLLFIPNQESELRLGAFHSRNSSLVYTDILYLGLVSKNLEEFKEKLKYSRAVVKSLYD